jgi:hypothetical protein
MNIIECFIVYVSRFKFIKRLLVSQEISLPKQEYTSLLQFGGQMHPFWKLILFIFAPLSRIYIIYMRARTPPYLLHVDRACTTYCLRASCS